MTLPNVTRQWSKISQPYKSLPDAAKEKERLRKEYGALYYFQVWPVNDVGPYTVMVAEK